MRGSRGTLVPLVVLTMMLVANGGGQAHEAIGAEATIALVEQVTTLKAEAEEKAGTGSEARVEAACELGAKMQLVVQVLNRDLADHYGSHSMRAKVLTAQLKARGFNLSLWVKAGRYRNHLAPLETCIELAPDGLKRNDALFQLVRGRFYDSFIYDPLQTVGLDWPSLQTQIANAERFHALRPRPTEREEIAFVLAVNYVRAARMTPDPERAQSLGGRARAALDEFVRAYPDSVRAQAARVLAAAIPAAN